MDLKQLTVFLDLADSLHFGNTSRRQHMSPSTLSRTLQRLEQHAGAVLFTRTNRQVSLTAAGEQYRMFAASVVAEWQQLQANLHADDEQLQGQVSLYCSVTASHSLLAGILANLRATHPGIELMLHTGDQAQSLDRLVAAEEDMVIAAHPEKLLKAVLFKRLARSRLVFIGPRRSCAVRDLLQACTDDLHKLAWSEVPLVVSERGLARRRIDAWLRKRRAAPNIYAQVTGHEAIVSMVALGCGVGLVPELVLAGSPVRDSIDVLNIEPDLPDFDIGLCVLQRRITEPLLAGVWESIV